MGFRSLPERIQTYQDLRLFLDLDLKAQGISRWGLRTRFQRPEVGFQRALRRAEWSSNLKGLGRCLYVWHRFLLQRASVNTGISLPLGVCGPGLSIAHYGSIVVNSQARIGAFCRLHSATNIGIHQGSAPKVGDFVYIGPGAVLYGDAVIGDRAVIGANSVVAQNVPDDSTAVGAPARIIEGRDSTSVMPSWIASLMTQD